MTIVALAPIDLAALLCSRVCHDVIGPVGAIVNGLEVLEDEKDQQMRDVAVELIKKSAAAASARLQFCRLAFGAAGGISAAVDAGDVEKVARGLIVNERTALVWNPARQLLDKKKVKLLLNLVLIATFAIARGGVVTVDLAGQGETLAIRVKAKGPNARLAHGVAELLAGRPQSGEVDAHTIQPFFAGLVARDCGMEVAILAEADTVTLEARPAAAVAA
jgi:histidine phosphotransferase ChpT